MRIRRLFTSTVIAVAIAATPGYASAAQTEKLGGSSKYTVSAATAHGRITLKFAHADNKTKPRIRSFLAKVTGKSAQTTTKERLLDPPPTPIYSSVGNYAFTDSNGTFNIRYNRSSSNINWGYTLSPALQAAATSDVAESGLFYQVNDGPIQQNSPHLEPASYFFHGTMTPVHDGDIVDYVDAFVFRVNVGGQTGTADVEVGGRVQCFP